MEFHLIAILRTVAALTAGGLIGYAFGLFQHTALRRNEERARQGLLISPWSLIPGAGGRVALLLIALALIQIVCPLFFVGGVEWFVSAGLLLGYGVTLTRQLRQRLRASAPVRPETTPSISNPFGKNIPET